MYEKIARWPKQEAGTFTYKNNKKTAEKRNSKGFIRHFTSIFRASWNVFTLNVVSLIRDMCMWNIECGIYATGIDQHVIANRNNSAKHTIGNEHPEGTNQFNGTLMA